MKKVLLNPKYLWLCFTYKVLEIYTFIFNRYLPALKKKKINHRAKLHIYYRMSDFSFKKARPDYITNFNCLNNFLKHFNGEDITIIADNVIDTTYDSLKGMGLSVIRTDYKNGADSFNHALTLALKQDPGDYIYFVEDDYVHREGAQKILLEGLKTGADYVTLYDGRDLYSKEKPNWLLNNIPSETKILISKSVHWRLIISTTMTFAARVSTLMRDEKLLRKYTANKYPYDFHMFLALRKKRRSLISPMPSYSTHGYCKALAPLVYWKKEL